MTKKKFILILKIIVITSILVLVPFKLMLPDKDLTFLISLFEKINSH